MPRFRTPFRNVFVVHLHCKLEDFCKSEGFFRETESFSKEVEGFFRRVLGLCTHKFLECGAALLTYLPRSRLGLPGHPGLPVVVIVKWQPILPIVQITSRTFCHLMDT